MFRLQWKSREKKSNIKTVYRDIGTICWENNLIEHTHNWGFVLQSITFDLILCLPRYACLHPLRQKQHWQRLAVVTPNMKCFLDSHSQHLGSVLRKKKNLTLIITSPAEAIRGTRPSTSGTYTALLPTWKESQVSTHFHLFDTFCHNPDKVHIHKEHII